MKNHILRSKVKDLDGEKYLLAKDIANALCVSVRQVYYCYTMLYLKVESRMEVETLLQETAGRLLIPVPTSELIIEKMLHGAQVN